MSKRIAIKGLGSGTKYIWLDEDENYHREDGPAVEAINGDKFWFIHGKMHRLDGPASEFADGQKEWFIEDEHIPVSSQEEFEKIIKLKVFW